MNKIPYGKQWINEDDIIAVMQGLRSDFITTGPKVEEFEKAICDYIGCFHSTVVNSGTSALDIAVHALELPIGSEIITTPFSFVSTTNAILYNNHIPVFVDIEKETRNIDVDKITDKITSSTEAIIYTDYAGHPCDIKQLQEISEDNDLFLIEDACHAFGAEYDNKKIGNFDDMTVFSFHPLKHITTGEGGAVVTNNALFDKKLKCLRQIGIQKKKDSYLYDVKYLSGNYKLTDFQCALGLSQLKRADFFLKLRENRAWLYNHILRKTSFELPKIKSGIRHSWHMYTVLTNDRDEFYKYMKENKINVQVHYIPIYQFSYYKDRFNFNSEDYPVTEEVFSKIITLPLFPEMKLDDIEHVCNIIENWE